MLAEDMPPTGRFVGLEHRFPIRVYFEDTDLSGVVYHANYLRYMERARSDMLRLVGVDQRAAWQAGEGAYVVRGMDIDWRAPARLDDALVVVSRLVRLRRAALDIHQRVMRCETLVAEATVEAAFVTPQGNLRRQPEQWMAAYAPLLWKESIEGGSDR